MAWDTPPGERIAYDLDGSVGTFSKVTDTERSVSTLAQGALAGLNSDRTGGLFLNQNHMLVLGSNVGLGSFTATYLSRPWIAILFPTPMRIRGVLAAVRIGLWSGFIGNYEESSGNMRTSVEVSFDTTNGEDGSWSFLTSSWGAPGEHAFASDLINAPNFSLPRGPDGASTTATVLAPYGSAVNSLIAVYRERDSGLEPEGFGVIPVSGALTRNVKGIRIHLTEFSGVSYPQARWYDTDGTSSNPYFSAMLVHFHLYGEPDTDALDDRLEFVTADGLSIKDFSYGDVSHNQTVVQTFKVRNLSSTLTANSIDLSVTAPNPGNTPNPNVELSLTGVGYSASIVVPSIPPSSDSATIYVRLIVPASGIIGGFTPRLLCEVGSWT